jgi:translation initiation factor 4A
MYQPNDSTVYEEFEEMIDSDNPLMEKLLTGIIKYGFLKPSEIQKRAIVPLVQGRNLVAQSQSGTGKTAAFAIGSLARIDPDLKKVQVVVIAPSHELSSQIHGVFCELASYMFEDVKSAITLCIGKQVSVQENMFAINKGSRVLVGTPGRIKHLINIKLRDHRDLVDPKYCKILILDEADMLLRQSDSSSDSDDIREIVNYLDNSTKRDDYLQFGIFSATFNSAGTLDDARSFCLPKYYELVKQYGDDWVKQPGAPLQILLQPDQLTLDGIAQYYFELDCGDRHMAFGEKAKFIKLLNSEYAFQTCIIYVNSGDTAENLKAVLNGFGLVTECIYGNLPPLKRAEITSMFRKNLIRILISTDLLARGFDVRQVNLVINFDMPNVINRTTCGEDELKLADYLHRIGRSGRYGRKGVAINLIASPSDRTCRSCIEAKYGIVMEQLPDDISQIYS